MSAQQETEASVDALYGCFRAATAHATHDATTVPFGPSSEAFFFEQLGAAMQAFGNSPKLAWCEPWFVEPYIKAHTALYGAPGVAKPKGHDPSLPLSTGVHWAQEARLIHLAARMGAVSHVSAHLDMMRMAMGAPQVARELARLRLSTCARGLLMQAAQVPDLYLFDEPLWHAHSPQNEAQEPPWPEAAELSRQQFVALVVGAVLEGQRAARALDVQRAMLLFGAAAHAVQDLQYHRGITQGEKAGLTYVAHSNPDGPAEPHNQQLVVAATWATAQLLTAALTPLPSHLGAHTPVVAEDFAALEPLIEGIWPEAHGLTYQALRAYFGMSWRYHREAGLRGPEILAQANLGRWSAQQTLQDILAGL